MSSHPLFLLGLLLGAAAGYALRSSKLGRTSSPADIFLGLTEDAFVACDASGTVTAANLPARLLFGLDFSLSASLCYPTGQPVPPGQLPLVRARQTGAVPTPAEYHLRDAAGIGRVFDVSARPMPEGGAAAVFRDVTARHTAAERKAVSQNERETLHRLGARLGAAGTLAEISRAAAEEALRLLGSPPDMQARLYSFDSAAQTLTRQAVVPEARPKRSQSAPPSPASAFDAADPRLWQLYVARQPVHSGTEYALPLLSGGLAVGHLVLSSSASGALDDGDFQALEILGSQTAPALAGPAAAARVASAEAQADALREIALAVAGGWEPGRLADLVTETIQSLTAAEVCTLSVARGKLSVLGTVYKDALLFPDRCGPDSPALHGKAVQKAWRTQKAAALLGLPNPRFEAAVWRAFAGDSDRHSIFALPIQGRRGVLAVYSKGEQPLPDAQIKLLETIAALLSLLPPASVPADPAAL